MSREIKDYLNNNKGKVSPVINSYRQAYSDRTALLMALLSKLAYLKFNPAPDLNKTIQDVISNLLGEKSLKHAKLGFWKKIWSCIMPCIRSEKLLNKMYNFISKKNYNHETERKKLDECLSEIDLKLVETFDVDDTQAILCAFNDKYLILAFRGTEKDSWEDIRSDYRASLKNCSTGGKVHTGFQEAYEKVHDLICAALKLYNQQANETPLLFITGHSLGGALATIATKRLAPFYTNSIAACYTFGSPRVVSPKWLSTVKTPIYRVVNASDCVTMLPPSWGFIFVTSYLLKLIPWIGEKLGTAYSEKFGDYLHAGDMRYLTSCYDESNYDSVQLLPSVSLMWRLRNWFKKTRPWLVLMGKSLKDHSINIYCKKLLIIAKRRNASQPVFPGLRSGS